MDPGSLMPGERRLTIVRTRAERFLLDVNTLSDDVHLRVMYNSNARLLDRVHFLSRAYFNCEMFIASLKDNEDV